MAIEKVEERDQLRLAAAVAQVGEAKAKVQLTMLELAAKQQAAAKHMDNLSALMKELRERYKLTEADAVDTATGEVTRTQAPPAPPNKES